MPICKGEYIKILLDGKLKEYLPGYKSICYFGDSFGAGILAKTMCAAPKRVKFDVNGTYWNLFWGRYIVLGGAVFVLGRLLLKRILSKAKYSGG